MDNSEENMPKKKKKGTVYTIILIVAAAVFVACAVIITIKLVSYRHANKTNKKLADEVVSNIDDGNNSGDTSGIPEPPITVDFDALASESTNAVGWVCVPSVSVSYPVVQGDDNDFYMDHMFNDEFSWSGSIFLDYKNISFDDLHSIVYGHHMQDGSMFAGLLEYDSKEFFDQQKEDNNNYFFIYTADKIYTYEIFSVTDVTFADNPGAYNIVWNSKDDLQQYIDCIAPLALYDTGVSVSSDDTIVTLYTCQSDSSSKVRHLVHGKLVATTDN